MTVIATSSIGTRLQESSWEAVDDLHTAGQ